MYYLPDGRTVREAINNLASSGNRKFNERLHPGVKNILGVRVPDLRALARVIARDDVWSYLSSPGDYYMEERILHGLVLGCIKVDDVDRYLAAVDCFVNKINSWSVCDTFDFSGKKRFVAANRDKVWHFLLGYVNYREEYAVRFAVVMLRSHFLDEEHLVPVVDLLESISHQGYYVRMAIAWALSEAYVKNPGLMKKRFADSRLDDFTLNKAIQKTIESYRVSPEDKAMLKGLKRRGPKR